MSGTHRLPRNRRRSGVRRTQTDTANYNRYANLATQTDSSNTEDSDESRRASSPPILEKNQPESIEAASNQPDSIPRKRQFSVTETSVAPAVAGSTGMSQDVDNMSFFEDEHGWMIKRSRKKLNKGSSGVPSEPYDPRETSSIIDVSPDKFSIPSAETLDLSDMQLVGDYSRNANRELLQKTDYKIYKGSPTSEECNLLRGFKNTETAVCHQPAKTEQKYSITWLDNYLCAHKDLLKQEINFVSTVGTIRLLLIACYEHKRYDWAEDWKSNWTIYAKKVNRVWYLSECWPNCNDGVAQETKYAARMFELLMTSERTVKAAAQAANDVSKNVKTYQLWTARLGDHLLLYSGEVDCCEEDLTNPAGCNKEATIELKTTKDWKLEQGKKTIRPSIVRRTWAQAFLMGSKKVVCGHLEYRGANNRTLTDTKEYETRSMNHEAEPNWKTEVCLAVLNNVLNDLKKEDVYQDNVTYELTLDREKEKIIVRKSDTDLSLKCI